MFGKSLKDKKWLTAMILALLMTGILAVLPSGFEDAGKYEGTERVVGEVTKVNNAAIFTSGVVQSGEQYCTILIKKGKLKGKEVEGVNFLTGSLEKDKIFQKGDRALVTISHDKGEIKSVVMTDHYRLNKELILLALFGGFLILFAGKTGVSAIFSFIITVLMIWKVLIPSYLKGYSPVWIGAAIVTVLTIIIIYFVFGPSKKTIAAVMGSMLGIITTCIMGILFTGLFQIHGAVMSDSESLLYSGYQHLNLTGIFMSSIFIGASGAMMDLAVDITSAVAEVIEKKPEMDWKEAAKSGLNVGRAAMGTMTTTLLLAYSGGYVALLMVFMAQGTPVDHILNYKYVAAEILDTVVGSFGLVLVAPFTAMTAGILLTRRPQEGPGQEKGS